MGHLGSYGETRPPAEDTFTWFGADMRVHPDMSDLTIIAMFANLDPEEDPAAALVATADFTRHLVHPDDYEQFMALAMANRQTIEDVARLAQDLISGMSDRPTQLPTDSSDGQRRTATKSKGDSSSRALELLEGRPDLGVTVLRAREAQPKKKAKRAG